MLQGMVRLVRRIDPTTGLVLVNQATVAGDSTVAYFLAMLLYRRNPTDPEALALLHGISGGLLLTDVWWENCDLHQLRYWVMQDLRFIADRFWLRSHEVELHV